ncbi:MAG: hydroxymethylbilane synthase [Caldisphaera sp.]|jgi:hydroxymethylbilane synthase|nr:hydroxymethylbilane synthase [Caldisphaera sp.]PMP61161.1 MAG: hydroxymethylbilane synthase [Caldisphaera sp.]
MKIKVASRGSKLSIKQVEIFENYIKRFMPDLEMEKIIVKTKGDIIHDKPLYEIGEKGIFEKEVNNIVINDNADIAIHSMKDLPKDIDPKLDIIMVLPREIPNDSLVFTNKKINSIGDIPDSSIIGTSSIRRASFILHYNNKVKIKPIRGNIDTRLKKLYNNEYDFIIMAEAGLIRLNLNPNRIILPLDQFPPEPNQGIIAVVGKKGDKISDILSKYSDKNTYYEAVAEREFLKEAQAGCHSPIGAVARLHNNMITLIAAIASRNGKKMYLLRFKDYKENASKLGQEAGNIIYELIERVSNS